jgi:hypothetical protein
MPLSWSCHAVAMPLQRSRHAVATPLPCRCHGVAMPLPWNSHAVARPLPCICHGVATPLPCRHGVSEFRADARRRGTGAYTHPQAGGDSVDSDSEFRAASKTSSSMCCNEPSLIAHTLYDERPESRCGRGYVLASHVAASMAFATSATARLLMRGRFVNNSSSGIVSSCAGSACAIGRALRSGRRGTRFQGPARDGTSSSAQ